MSQSSGQGQSASDPRSTRDRRSSVQLDLDETRATSQRATNNRIAAGAARAKQQGPQMAVGEVSFETGPGYLPAATPTPYPYSRGQKWKHPVIGTIIHATKGGRASKIAFSNKSSWHFTIGREGEIYQHRSIHRSAGHAGRAKVRFYHGGTVHQGKWVNARTFGIELANYLNVVDVGSDKRRRWRKFNHKEGFVTNRKTPGIGEVQPGDAVTASVDSPRIPTGPKRSKIIKKGEKVHLYWETYPEKQIAGLKSVLLAIATSGYPEALLLTGHEEILSGKRDPGPAFPMDELQAWALDQYFRLTKSQQGAKQPSRTLVPRR